MNIAFFVKPKSTVPYLYEDHSLMRGLCRLRESGASALPVLSRKGKYLGAVSEGTFLWYLADRCMKGSALQSGKVRDLLPVDGSKAIPVTTTVQELLRHGMNQNFVSVVDDVGSFVGVVLQSEVMGYFFGQQTEKEVGMQKSGK